MPIAPRERLIVALDLSSVEAAEALVARLGDAVSFYKIGYQLAYAGGLAYAQKLSGAGKQVFRGTGRGVAHSRRHRAHLL
jgi:orotidine-5'-phosphate decarboxylase